MTTSITISAKDRRVYLLGNTYPIKDRIKSLGGHWDADRRAWWVGSGKRAEAEALVAAAPAPSAGGYSPTPITDATEVFGRVEYKGRPYYVVAKGRERYRLCTLDAKIDFWALHADCAWSKRYEARARFGGYSRGTVYEQMTLGQLRRFVADQRSANPSRVQCVECGSWHDAAGKCRDCGGC